MLTSWLWFLYAFMNYIIKNAEFIPYNCEHVKFLIYLYEYYLKFAIWSPVFMRDVNISFSKIFIFLFIG